jgi:hypothetical protein
MQLCAIVLLCVLAAVVYGVLHDQVTARICVEYFTIGHLPIFGADRHCARLAAANARGINGCPHCFQDRNHRSRLRYVACSRGSTVLTRSSDPSGRVFTNTSPAAKLAAAPASMAAPRMRSNTWALPGGNCVW